MAPNETTVLLTNYREKRSITSSRNSYGAQNGESLGSSTLEDTNHHIVQVSKGASDYEPIFSIDDYSSALTLAELLPYQDDPWWQKCRCIVFFAFWLTVIMTFITACTLSYMRMDHLSCQSVDSNLMVTTLNGVTTMSSLLPSTATAKVLSSAILDKNLQLALVKAP